MRRRGAVTTATLTATAPDRARPNLIQGHNSLVCSSAFWTALNTAAESTDQKVGGSNPSERADRPARNRRSDDRRAVADHYPRRPFAVVLSRTSHGLHRAGAAVTTPPPSRRSRA
jgi:hypothetical protein